MTLVGVHGMPQVIKCEEILIVAWNSFSLTAIPQQSCVYKDSQQGQPVTVHPFTVFSHVDGVMRIIILLSNRRPARKMWS